MAMELQVRILSSLFSGYLRKKIRRRNSKMNSEKLEKIKTVGITVGKGVALYAAIYAATVVAEKVIDWGIEKVENAMAQKPDRLADFVEKNTPKSVEGDICDGLE